MREADSTVFGFDYGLRRIGIAVGETITGSARALQTIAVRRDKPDWVAIESLVKQWSPEMMVVGVPAHNDRNQHALATPISRFMRQLGGRFGVPVYRIDERLSSHAASESGSTNLDADAACVILESWLREFNNDSGLANTAS